MNPKKFEHLIELALKEDIGKGDITTEAVCKNTQIKSAIVSKDKGIIAGLEIAKQVFLQISSDTSFKGIIKDGEKAHKNQIIAYIKGKAKNILIAERTALNFLNHLSGVATLTSKYVEKVKSYRCKILDTRKTTPAFRELEKYAVRMGGGENHRKGLYDMVLIKDNHLELALPYKKIKDLLNSVRKKVRKDVKIEVEINTLEKFKEVYNCGVDIIMLDNMSPKEIARAVNWTKTQNIKMPPKLEASGRVNLLNVEKVAKTGVDFISIGEITHSAPSFDTSLEIISSKI